MMITEAIVKGTSRSVQLLVEILKYVVKRVKLGRCIAP